MARLQSNFASHADASRSYAPRLPRDEITRAAIDAFEKRRVLHLLAHTQHNVSKAARLAGIESQRPLPHDDDARRRPQRVKRA
jgi:transcriptional regulator with GAF, ATPase, and Fis domain